MTESLLGPGEQLPPIDVEEFRFVWALAMEAVARKMPVHPKQYRVTIGGDSGESTTYAIGDTVDGRAAIAAKEHFEPDKLRLQSFLARFYGLLTQVKNPEMKRWIKPDPQDPNAEQIHYAVMDTAAQLPLRLMEDFDPASFFKAVEERAAIDPGC
jgi:hypothetical protein